MDLNNINFYFTKFSWAIIPAIQVISIILIAYIINFFTRKFFAKLEHQKENKQSILYNFLSAISNPVTAFIWLLALTSILRVAEWHLDKNEYFEWIGPINRVCIILILMWVGNLFVDRSEKEILNKNWLELNLDATSTLAIGRLCRIFLFMIAALMILPIVGLPISGVLALGGVGGIAVGFAAKEMFSNILGGAMLYLGRPFLVNDFIELPEKKIAGTVQTIGWRNTKIKLLDSRVIFVPNSAFASTNVINSSRRTHYRLEETINIRYDDIKNLPKVIKDIETMIRNHPDIDNNELLHVGLSKFDSYSLNCLILCYVKKKTIQDYLMSLENILFEINKIIENNKVEFAYPTSSVYVRKL